MARRCGDQRLLGVEPDLSAEPATDVWRDHVHLGGVRAERSGDHPMEEVRHLRRAVHDEASVAPWCGGGTERFHRRHGDPLVHVAAPNDDIGVAEDRVVHRIGGDEGDVVPVRFEDDRRTVRQRVLGMHHGGQRLVVDDDQVRRVVRLGGGLGEHDGHDLADEANDVAWPAVVARSRRAP